jgi:hypothetical protein
MRLVEAVPDKTAMVSGFEHQTFQCPDGHGHGRQRVFKEVIGPLISQPMGPPSTSARSPGWTCATPTAAASNRSPWDRMMAALAALSTTGTLAKAAAIFSRSSHPRAGEATEIDPPTGTFARAVQSSTNGEQGMFGAIAPGQLEEVIFLLGRLSQRHRATARMGASGTANAVAFH